MPFALLAFLVPDIIVVGAGAGGLATALEAARGGARVTVVDLASVFGGHAVAAEGGLSFPGSPRQKLQGIDDSPELMTREMRAMGGDVDERWLRVYAERSIPDVHDWLVEMGVQFHNVLNAVDPSLRPRFHENPKRGFGVVAPVYRECLKTGRVEFIWNTRITKLRVEGGRVTGVEGKNDRTGAAFARRAAAVVLATGGFQANLELVRRHWPSDQALPKRMLIGAGVNAKGLGLELGRTAGAAATRLDHQWNYPRGIPDPRYPGTDRGLHVIVAQNFLWVNERGEAVEVKYLPELMKQPNGHAFLIFDRAGRASFRIAGTDWVDRTKVEKLLLDNPAITQTATELAELAKKTGIEETALSATVAKWNQGKRLRVLEPPFHAVELSPITRKSMGGLAIDMQCRVLNAKQQPIPGLYAVGEVAGFGGLNGSASIEGTFIAPALLQGRIVGRELGSRFAKAEGTPQQPLTQAGGGPEAPCRTCHAIEKQVATSRPGYWHFERVHRRVLSEQRACAQCHAEMSPFRAGAHRIDRIAQIDSCEICHLPPR